MKSRVSFFLALALTLSSYQPVIALMGQPLVGQNPVAPQQAQQPQHQDEPKIRIGTAEVTLDVVVRDKKGRPVKDLTGTDFEVYEDGARQSIESFRLVQRESEIKGNRAPNREKEIPGVSAPPLAAARESATPGVIALVFD